MERFHIIDDAAVILRVKGVYRQVKVYQRAGELYAGWGGGFIGLRRNNGTTRPDISWVETDATCFWNSDGKVRLGLPPGGFARAIAEAGQ